jgi:hypothetical protein
MLLSLLNSQYPSIKFTCEEEVGGNFPFLDVRVTRRYSKLEFDVYRKPSNTQRCISITTCHPMEHKMAAFHSMLYRAYNLPLSTWTWKAIWRTVSKGLLRILTLLEYSSIVLKSIESKCQMNTYTDFLKAFDKVRHCLLLDKMSSNVMPSHCR